MSNEQPRCEYDGCEIKNPRAGQRFGSEKCRQAWHREHSPRGVIKGVRKLGNGGTSIVLHFADADAEAALRFIVKQRVVLGRLDGVVDLSAPAMAKVVDVTAEAFRDSDDARSLLMELGRVTRTGESR